MRQSAPLSPKLVKILVGSAVGLVCLLALAVLVAVQALYQGDEAEELARRTKHARSEVETLKTIGGRAEELSTHLEELRAKVALVQKILPESLGLAEFRSSFEVECASRGLHVVRWETREDKSKEVQQGIITAVLGGELARLPDLQARMRWLPRLVDSREGKREGEAQTLELTIYALPRKPQSKPVDCEGPASDVWLWPFTSKLRPARSELQDVCRELATLSGPKSQADEYFVLKTHLLAAVAAIESLRPEGRSGDSSN